MTFPESTRFIRGIFCRDVLALPGSSRSRFASHAVGCEDHWKMHFLHQPRSQELRKPRHISRVVHTSISILERNPSPNSGSCLLRANGKGIHLRRWRGNAGYPRHRQTDWNRGQCRDIRESTVQYCDNVQFQHNHRLGWGDSRSPQEIDADVFRKTDLVPW